MNEMFKLARKFGGIWEMPVFRRNSTAQAIVRSVEHLCAKYGTDLENEAGMVKRRG